MLKKLTQLKCQLLILVNADISTLQKTFGKDYDSIIQYLAMFNSVCYIFFNSYYTLFSTGLCGGMEMNIQFKKGALEFIVLLIIKSEDQYGYSLVQKITPRIKISEGTVYPLLRRLVKEEYLTTYYEASTEGPARKYYRITELGNERLESLLKEWQSFTDAVNLFLEESECDE